MYARSTSTSPPERLPAGSNSSLDSTVYSPASVLSRPSPASGSSSSADDIAYSQAGEHKEPLDTQTGANSHRWSNSAGHPTHPDQYLSPQHPSSFGSLQANGGSAHRGMGHTSNEGHFASSDDRSKSSSNSTGTMRSGSGQRTEHTGSSTRGSTVSADDTISGGGSSSGSTSQFADNAQQIARHASKARRMSSGGSRIPSEDADENRNGYGRSASDSGSDWRHEAKAPYSGESDARRAHRYAVEDEARDQSSSSSDQTNIPGSHGRLAPDADRSPAPAVAQYSDSPSQSSSSSRPHMDLASFPPQELLRILASLLHQIATANDQLRPRRENGPAGGGAGASNDTSIDEKRTRARGRNAAIDVALAAPSFAPVNETESNNDWLADVQRTRKQDPSLNRPTTAALTALQAPSSTLCFRARNVPSISIEAYLLRILRYCPASCEVFVSLLVYFDRMSKMGQQASEDARRYGEEDTARDEEDDARAYANGRPAGVQASEHGSLNPSREDGDRYGSASEPSYIGMRGFAIDSFNVHRLVIAGVTVASKFFSDVFYTNSRYAKVGGLPVHELNQLELQFLLLNNFKLMIPLEEMQRYADQLLLYGGGSSVESPAQRPMKMERSPMEAISKRVTPSNVGQLRDKEDGAHSKGGARENGEPTAAASSANRSTAAASSAAPSSALASNSVRDLHGDTAMATGDA